MRSRGPWAHAIHALVRRPAFTASVALTLGLGVGANVAVFSLVDASLLTPLPYPEADRLVLAWEARPERGWKRFGVSAPAYRDWRERVTSLQHLVAFHVAEANLEGALGAERVNVLHATADLLPTLRLRPHLGRGLEPGDERPGATAALLGFGAWRRVFWSDPGVLGRSLRVGRESVTVVGVLGPEIGAPFASADLVRPLAVGDDARRGARWLTVLGRLAPGHTRAEAQSELEALALRHTRDFPDTNTGWTVTLVGLPEAAREDGRLTLLLLSGAVGLVLLLACANVAQLLLVRTLARERELAIRAALGAGPSRLAQPVLAEALVLAALGGASGLVIALAGHGLLRAAVPESGTAATVLDGRALAAGLAFAVLSGLLVALLPVAHAWRASGPLTLRSLGSTAATPVRRRSRQALVVAQLAVAFTLLAGAGVLVRTVRHLLNVDLGFRPESTLAFRVAPPQVVPAAGQSEEAFIAALLEDRDRAAAFYADMLDRWRAAPGVVSAGAVNRLPLTGGWWVMGFEVEGRAKAAPGDDRSAFGRVVTPGYFATMGMRLRAGRDFSAFDSAGGQPVVVIDDALARREFGETSPLGTRLRIDERTLATIVGVVSGTRTLGLDRPASPTFYVPLTQSQFGFYPDWGMDVVVRTARDPGALVPQVRRLLREQDPTLPAYAVRTLEELVTRALGPRRDALRLLGAFSLLALLLAALGLYGVLAQLARERAREFGVRLALGARALQIGTLVLADGLRLAVLGAGLGLLGALVSGRALQGLLHGVAPADPLALAGSAGLLVASAALAALPSILRAARLDPAAVLRDE
jgi:predicted permease